MFWTLMGIFFGLIIGLSLNISIPVELTKYTAVVIMGILDSVVGAIRAETTNDRFDGVIFITGLLFNIMVSIIVTVLGDRLGLDLYLAVAFVFTFRIITNIGAARRFFLDQYMASKKKK